MSIQALNTGFSGRTKGTIEITPPATSANIICRSEKRFRYQNHPPAVNNAPINSIKPRMPFGMARYPAREGCVNERKEGPESIKNWW
ncbi:MAG: hypothetical protein AMXMBFR7_48990 [Planctomycetota bacterium]